MPEYDPLSDLRSFHPGNDNDEEEGYSPEDEDEGDDGYSNTGGYIDPELLGHHPPSTQIKLSPSSTFDPRPHGSFGESSRGIHGNGNGNGITGYNGIPGGAINGNNQSGGGARGSGQGQGGLNPGVKRSMSENHKTCDNCRRRKVGFTSPIHIIYLSSRPCPHPLSLLYISTLVLLVSTSQKHVWRVDVFSDDREVEVRPTFRSYGESSRVKGYTSAF